MLPDFPSYARVSDRIMPITPGLVSDIGPGPRTVPVRSAPELTGASETRVRESGGGRGGGQFGGLVPSRERCGPRTCRAPQSLAHAARTLRISGHLGFRISFGTRGLGLRISPRPMSPAAPCPVHDRSISAPYPLHENMGRISNGYGGEMGRVRGGMGRTNQGDKCSGADPGCSQPDDSRAMTSRPERHRGAVALHDHHLHHERIVSPGGSDGGESPGPRRVCDGAFRRASVTHPHTNDATSAEVQFRAGMRKTVSEFPGKTRVKRGPGMGIVSVFGATFVGSSSVFSSLGLALVRTVA